MKLRRVANKTVSVGLAVTTSLWMTGSAFLVAVPAAYALGNEGVVTDVTGSNPRISENGESERVMLGINLARTDNTDIVTLQSIRVLLDSSDGADEAAASNIEEVRLYRDSSLAGTNGVFDENDSLVHSLSRTSAAGSVLDGTVAGINGAGDTVLCVTETASTIVNGDFVKIGAGATSEIRDVTTLADTGTCITANNRDAWTVGALTYEHVDAEAVREVTALTAAATEGFQAYGVVAGAISVELGDTTLDVGGVMTGAYDIPKTDSSDEAGDDVFIVLTTADGLAGQNVNAQVWGADAVQYSNATAGPLTTAVALSTGTNTTDGTTVDVEFGADGTAPSITKVETYDNDKNGRVDRVKVYFDESMADTEDGTENFVDALSGDPGEINSVGSGAVDDIDLNTTGTWMTTTVLNDTFQIDFQGDVDDDTETPNDGEYSNANNSTGDTWSFIYDESGTDVMKDATGENLLDTTITTVDMARPEMMSAQLKDNNGDDQVDSLEVTWSEKLSSSSDAAGYTLTNTTDNPDTDYTLGAVTSFKKGEGADANTDDTMVIAVTELSDDVNDAFNLDYTASATVTDTAGNEGNSQTNEPAPVDVEPRIEKVEYRDADSDGEIDSALITFTRAVDSDDGWEDEFSLSEGYTVNAGTTTDADNTTTLTLGINQSLSPDTDKTPELTYTKPAAGAALDVCLAGDADCDDVTDTALESVVAGDVVEEDDAPPVLLTATFYDSDNDTIWENGETLQFLFSEDVDAAQVATGWNQSGADGSVFIDWQLDVDAGDTGVVLGDALVPDSGTIGVTGRVLNLSATDDATTALNATDEVSLIANEIKDMAGNSAVVDETANEVGSGPLADLDIETDPSAPVPTNIETRDMDGNGVLDALEVEFEGMIAASSITMAEWAAARGANAFDTENVVPDLTVTSVVTVSGGDDTRVLVSFVEANEGTGAMPEVKYVGVATLQDLAGNDIADFNQNTADDAEFEQGGPALTYPSTDGADPVVVLKRLRDRNLNGQYDQLTVVLSEDMGAAGAMSSDGWTVADHDLASSGMISSNTGDYDAYTFAATDNVFKTDILESGAPTALPSVSYASTGAFADVAGRVLGDVLAGGEESPDIAVFAAPPASVSDGDLFQLTGGDGSVWIAKIVGTKKFRRHVLWSDFDVIYPHLAPMWPVMGVDQATYDTYSLSAWIRITGTAPVYEVNDDMTAHWITCDDDPVAGQDCANEWTAAGGDPDGIFDINGVGGEWDRLTQTNDVVLPDVAN